jgi:HD-GYP domain-containing protein (c-di-GMP phosphodiesterase class II)
MSADRPYRKARSTETIIEELKKCSGTQFDPHVATVATEILQEKLMEERPETVTEGETAKAPRTSKQLRPLDSTS